jgi:LmbE family N-acetylglucosaminyl deacetylase
LLALTLDTPPRSTLEVLCIGAHCDDIEIGCGGTVLAIQRRYPRCKVHFLVLTSTAARRAEAAASAKALVKASARGQVRICELPDGLLPAHLVAVKAEFERMKKAIDPDLVLTHHALDRHQDHSLISHVTWQTFRDHMIWEYEIPKFDGDLSTPNMYVPLPSALAARKIALVMRAFPSQNSKPWFKAENLEATMRLRGLESRAPSGYAEAFHCRKLLSDITAGKSPTGRSRLRKR